ncbi:D-hexose-6-phosphate mutarotase [Celerinatantimonas sp. MCCC 1A17872]|uniref:D-hexose-6-phosphate mutarotase n=1 Tax=Celerinatantimonas sp. MCCC 1A17872 TaxID=3177514 RepID=UPI0038C2EF45
MTERLKELGLSIDKQLDNAVFSATNSDGVLFYWVDHPQGKALISAYGAHIISYHPTNQSEQFWLSKTSALDGSAPIRGGVPICWPWFGNTRQPNHGYARTQIWKLGSIKTTEENTELTLTLSDDMLDEPEFKFALECKFTVGKELHIDLTTTNLDDHTIELGAALHSYFAADRDSAKVTGMGDTFLDKTDNFAKKTQSEFALAEENDRLYIEPSHNVTLIHGDGRQLKLTHQGEDTVVIWNPGDTKAEGIADIHAGGAKEYLCVESVRTQNPVKLGVKETYTLSQHLAPKA